ncbi:MAG: TRAP transporter small permease [Eubacteriales bacterium]|nr:TRAP transporter small permease [Eubacteriales bacterium]
MAALKWLDKHFEHVILAVLLVILTLLSFLNVILRYAFQSGLSWSDEVCKYALVLSGFVSVPCWIRYNTGIRVDALVGMFPEKLKTMLLYLTDLLMIGFLGFMTKGAADMAATCASVNQKSPALQIPMAWLYELIAFFFLLSIFRYVQMIILKHVPAEVELAEGELTEEEQAALDKMEAQAEASISGKRDEGGNR